MSIQDHRILVMPQERGPVCPCTCLEFMDYHRNCQTPSPPNLGTH